MFKRIQVLIGILLVFALLLTACDSGTETPAAGGETGDGEAAGGAEEAGGETENGGDGENLVVAIAHRNLLSDTGADIRAAAYYVAAQEGVEIKFFDANGDVEAQANFIDDCIAGGEVKAIMLWTADADGISETVRECNTQGIPVVSVDIAIPGAEVVNHVASDNVQVGRLAGQAAVDYLIEKNGSASGTVVICTATNMDSLRYRTQGFLEVIEEHPEIETITHEMVSTTMDDGVALADDLMQLYPVGSIDVLYGASASPGLGALTAAQTYNRTDFGIVSVDYNSNLSDELQKGAGNTNLIGFVAQDPFNIGETGMTQTIKAARGQDTGEVQISTNVILVTADNVQDYLDDYAAYAEKVSSFR